jgi:plastocyanin
MYGYPFSSSNGGQSNAVHVSMEAGSGIDPNTPGYLPDNITVVIGVNNTVNWINSDDMPHTVTALDGSFDSGDMQSGQSYFHTFDKPGVFSYVCIYHHWMQGTVAVLANHYLVN